MKAIIDRERVRALRAQGLFYREIAAELGCSQTGVWAALFPEKARDNQRRCHARRLSDPAYIAACRANARKTMRKRYGIKNPTSETRGGPCGICARHRDVLRLDHDHATGEIRGWLCTSCNRGLGYLQDNPDVLRKALAYLERIAPK